MAATDISLPLINAQQAARFWGHVQRTKVDDCWNWLIGKDRAGYGKYTINGSTIRSHRIAFFLSARIDPVGCLVCHHCDNPSCCNPRHLFLGSTAMNVQDKCNKGRQSKGVKHAACLNPASGDNNGARLYPDRLLRGEDNGNSKLRLEDVKEIRRRFAEHKTLRYKLAQEFGVSNATIGLIIKKVAWKHII